MQGAEVRGLGVDRRLELGVVRARRPGGPALAGGAALTGGAGLTLRARAAVLAGRALVLNVAVSDCLAAFESFAGVIAPAWICADPTLLPGRVAAAQETPPRERNRASVEATLA